MNELTSIAFPDPADAEGDRRAARDSMFLAVEIEHVATGEVFSARARNISAGGLMADERDGLAVGDRVAVTLRGIGRVEGHAAWIREGRVGIAFDRPIDPKLTRKPVGAAKARRSPGSAERLPTRS